MTHENSIPFSWKEKVIRFAKKLPKSSQAEFARKTTRELAEFSVKMSKEHPHTVTYAIIGFIVGQILDNALRFTVPVAGEISLTADLAGTLLPIIGGGFGFWKDRETANIREILTRQIRSALAQGGDHVIDI